MTAPTRSPRLIFLEFQARAALALAALVAAIAVAGCGDLAELAGVIPPTADVTVLDGSGPIAPPAPEETDATDAPPLPSNQLTLTSVEPNTGDPAGGIDVLVRGTGFRDGLYALFDQSVAPDVFVVDARTAIIRVPPHPPGLVDLTIGHSELNNGEPVVLPNAFRYSSSRTLSAIDPFELPVSGGVPLTVFGTGFDDSTRVMLGGRLALSQNHSNSEIFTAVSPEGSFGWQTVHLTSTDDFSAHPRAVFFFQPPTLETTASPQAGAAEVTLYGQGLVADADVLVGDEAVVVLDASPDGRTLTFVPPAANPWLTAPTDITVSTRWGTATLPASFRADGSSPACSVALPARGSTRGGEAIYLACATPAFDPARPLRTSVLMGDRVARVISQNPSGLVVESPGGPAGQTTIVLMADGQVLAAIPFELRLMTEPLDFNSIEPTSGDAAGGYDALITGSGFTAATAARIGALGVTNVRYLSPEQMIVRVPPGSPGLATVEVIESGVRVQRAAAFEYRMGSLAVFAASPTFVAQSGGTRIRIFGAGFGPGMRVTVGGVPCPIFTQVSGTEVMIRSPRLEPGAHDLVVTRPETNETITKPGAITAFDPRSGFGGTWGPAIDGTLNVTVYGSNGFGPIQNAHVIIGSDATTRFQGFTDDRGQISISEEGLRGPLEVTASAPLFSAASVVVFDAENVTMTLQMNPIPPPSEGEGNGEPPPQIFFNATLSGRVIGLDKYVLAPPGSCDALAAEEVRDCQACSGSDDTCGDDAAFACITLGSDGNRCLRACGSDPECGVGYRCGATSDGARCVPSPGIKSAQCNVTSTSVFGYNYPLQAGSVPNADGQYVLDSRRLGDLAAYCFGGYLQDDGAFVPTVLGVKRNIFAVSAQIMTGLDVELKYPLKRTFRVRLASPPYSPTGLEPPAISFSLNLGADGAIGFSRDPLPSTLGEPDTWLLPRQLANLTGDLYDGNYVFYTTLSPTDATSSGPRSYNLVQGVTRITEDRLPVREGGQWRLDGTQLERSLLGLWRAPDDRLFAVGEGGTILMRFGRAWTPQPSRVTTTLAAIDGLAGDDIWAVGEAGLVLHRDSLRWSPVQAPTDDYGAVAVTLTHVLVAGLMRLRVLDRTTGLWTIAGGPGVTGIRGVTRIRADLVLATGDEGRAWLWTPTAFIPLDLGAAGEGIGALRGAVVLTDDGAAWRAVIVGDAGAMAVIEGDSQTTRATRIDTGTDSDLTDVTVTAAGEVVAVGDHGAVVSWQDGRDARSETIEDYRSKAHGVAALSDGELAVVGSAAFILGPFLAFPYLAEPSSGIFGPDRRLAWRWDGGPEGQYTRLTLTPDFQMTAWTLIIDGATDHVTLPDLMAAADINVLPAARYRVELLRVLNRGFNIDSFTNRGFNLYLRDSWSTNRAYVTIEGP